MHIHIHTHTVCRYLLCTGNNEIPVHIAILYSLTQIQQWHDIVPTLIPFFMWNKHILILHIFSSVSNNNEISTKNLIKNKRNVCRYLTYEYIVHHNTDIIM